MEAVRICSSSKEIRGRIALPASKSLSNRALIMRLLSGGRITIFNLSLADDTRLLQGHLHQITQEQQGSDPLILDCKNAGTVLRFLTPLLSITPGNWLLSGLPRMFERPVGPLVKALNRLGAEITYTGTHGYPPLLIRGKRIQGGAVAIDAGISSQFISALLLAAPAFPEGVTLTLEGKISSRPYILMTLDLLRHAGIESTFRDNVIRIGPQKILPCDITIEPDWSSAAFWYELMALAESGELFLEGLHARSMQGDAILPRIFEHLGVSTSFDLEGIRLKKTGTPVSAFEWDFNDYPDLAQAVIATCAGLGIPSRLTGLESLRIKETDRLLALREELTKTGAFIELEGDSGLILTPGKNSTAESKSVPVFTSHGDHRMAMALAPLSIISGEVELTDPGVVIKSYPGYWDDLRSVGLKINRP